MIKNNKIINDPVYGFLTIPSDLIFELIQHPFFQRLRRIKQLGMTDYVYPGATHSRFHHALGALQLMTKAVYTLREKGVKITDAEAEALYIGILLHDIGHGPYSHTLEHTLIQSVSHEYISLKMMHELNIEFKGKLDLAIKIFQNQYKKAFCYQLISGQLDMDRLDYLSRDSFFTGVTEGVVGSERIINMLNVVDDELVVEEKGIYSIEKFIIARRLMYWQVYLHKTVVATDIVLTNIIKRAAEVSKAGVKLFATPSLEWFLENDVTKKTFADTPLALKNFASLDDSDIFSAIKAWQHCDDKILRILCKNLVERHLPKILVSSKPFEESVVLEKQSLICQRHKLKSIEASYFAAQNLIKNDAYKDESTRINILMKDGTIKDVTEASDNYNLKALKQTVKKYYLSYYP
ncbi:MAG: HD domain-containing protein [bacterium]|nr:HD domain-containing protein [bacterium]